MDLVPKPEQVVSAAGNVAHKLLYGGVADLRPMPRSLIDEGTLRQLYRYHLPAGVAERGDPVLLVTPLAAPALCYDLRRGCSVVEHLVQGGRPTYLVEYGQVSFRDRSLGMEHWIDEVLPEAVRRTSEHAGGRPVHVVGWSLGGIFALLTAADSPELPIATLSVVGSPADVAQVPLVAPLRPLLNLTEGRGLITRAYRAMGGAPQPLVRWAFQLSSFQKLVTKPVAVAVNLDDADFLAQVEAVDRFTANMIAYPGRSFGQLYHRFIKGNALRHGSMELGGRTIALADVAVPVLVFAGATDGIAPVGAVRALLPLLSGSPEVSFEIVPGGHLGMLTGRASRETTWRVLDEWFDQWSGRELPAGSPGGPGRSPAKSGSSKPAPKKAAPKKAAPRKAATRKATTTAAETARKPAKTSAPRTPSAPKKAAPRKRPASQPDPGAIGANPARRYGSAGSRSLAR